MAVDVILHAINPETEAAVADFMSHSFGSEHFDPDNPRYKESREVIRAAPYVLIGCASFLKAGLSDNPHAFVPTAITRISALIGRDMRVINNFFIAGVDAAMDTPNITSYDLGDKYEILAFLEQHIGEKAFLIFW